MRAEALVDPVMWRITPNAAPARQIRTTWRPRVAVFLKVQQPETESRSEGFRARAQDCAPAAAEETAESQFFGHRRHGHAEDGHEDERRPALHEIGERVRLILHMDQAAAERDQDAR